MGDEKRVKGVVVEDYDDRIVLSTIDGEKSIMKQKIERILYDMDEQNFNEEDYDKLFQSLLDVNLSTLPNTRKAIERYG